MGRVHALQFFVLLPVALGLFLGAARIGGYQFDTVGHHMAYMALFAVGSWLCYGIGSIVAARVLRPWEPPLLAVLLAGNVAGGFALWWPLRDGLNLLFAPYLQPGSVFGAFWPPPPDGFGAWLAITAQGSAWWLLANWLDFRYRRVPRFGFAPPPSAGPATAAREAAPPPSTPMSPGAATSAARAADPPPAGAGPRLAQRLPANLRGGEVYALEAEEHYTKVHTSRGHALLLMRFSDAIVEMDPQPGLQVHRSFWVSRHAVERVARVDRRWVVQLRGGLEVPVSRSYRVSVQAAGLAGGAAMTDD